MSHHPLAGHPSLSLLRVGWSAEGGCHELANPSIGPWFSPCPRELLQYGVPGQVPVQGKDLVSEVLALTLCRPCGEDAGLFYSGGAVEGNTALSMPGEALEFGTRRNGLPWRSPARGLLAKTF